MDLILLLETQQPGQTRYQSNVFKLNTPYSFYSTFVTTNPSYSTHILFILKTNPNPYTFINPYILIYQSLHTYLSVPTQFFINPYTIFYQSLHTYLRLKHKSKAALLLIFRLNEIWIHSIWPINTQSNFYESLLPLPIVVRIFF